MTLVQNPKTGNWEGDFRVPGVRRLHLSFRTPRKNKAEPLHAAVQALMREGDAALVDLLRGGKITAEQVARCLRDRQPFSALRPVLVWPTVAEAADAYLAALAANAETEASTAETARWQLQPFVTTFGAERLDGVSHEAADQWQRAIVSARAVNSARTTVGRAEALYRWHAAQEIRAAAGAKRTARPLVSPLDPETRPTRTTRRARFLTRDEAGTLLEATPVALRGHVGVLLFAGLRIEEALHLRVGVDVDLARDMLAVQERGEKGRPGYWRPKTGERREVPITADLRTILAHHLARHAGQTFVFPGTRRGRAGAERPMPSNTFREHFEDIVTRAGLVYGRTDPAGVVPHTLRHTFASWLVSADVNPYRVAKLMGNSLQQIEDTYGHLAPTDNRAAVALLSGAVPLPPYPDTAPPTAPEAD